MLEVIEKVVCEEYIALVIIAFVIAFILAFGIGANDVANTFGTSVGAGVLTLRQACILATIFETLGSILIGAKVSGTIRKGILDPAVFEGNKIELMCGYISALVGCCIWLLIATLCGLPVSGTHSIVGATIGMAIVSKGFRVIQWAKILTIAASWVISPLLSGLVSVLMFLLIKRFILMAKSPLKAGLAFLPIIYTVTVFINVGGAVQSAPPLLRLDEVPWWGQAIIVFGISIIVFLCVQFLLVPFLRKKLTKASPTEIELKAVTDNVQNAENSEKNKNTVLSLTNSNHPINRMNLRQFSAPGADNENTVNLTLEGYLLTVGPYMGGHRGHQKKTSQRKKTMSECQPSKLNKADKFTDGGAILAMPEPDSDQNSIKSNTKSVGRFTSIPVEKDPIPNKFRELFHNNSVDEDNAKETDKLAGVTEETSDKVPVPNKDSEVVVEDGEDMFAKADPPETTKLFSFLQILTAIFGSFAHGGNDVSNAIGPLIGVYLIYSECQIQTKTETPIWILLYGGLGISIGLWVLGRRVIKTIGEDLTNITPSSGFVIELASAMTVLGASLCNIPVSSTHCKVGSVVFTGRVRSKESVDWSLFRNIIVAWAVTVPITGVIAALVQVGFKLYFNWPFVYA